MLSTNALKIIDMIVSAPNELADAGATWYSDAHSLVTEWSLLHGYSVSQCAGVLAVLSPQQTWDGNQRNAINTIVAHKRGETVTQQVTGQTQAQSSKALQILDGYDVATVCQGGVPKSGHKVWSFYQNILQPDTSLAVTVDRHAIAIWATPETAFKCITPNRYARIESDYQDAGEALGMLPHQAQAISWCGYRGSAV
jgi:hypothetical protein